MSVGATTVDVRSCGSAACRDVQTVPLDEDFGFCDPCVSGPISGTTVKLQDLGGFYQMTITTRYMGSTSSSSVSPIYCGSCTQIATGQYAEVLCNAAPSPNAPSPNAPAPSAPTPPQMSGLCPRVVPCRGDPCPYGTVEAVSCGNAACRAAQTIPLGEEFGLCDPCVSGPIAGVTLEVGWSTKTTYNLKITQMVGGYSQSQQQPVECGTCVEINGFSAEIPCHSGGDSGVPVAAIVGAVVGVLVLIGLVVGVVFFLRWRQGQMAKATGVASGLDIPLSEAKGQAQYSEMGSPPGAVHQGQDTEMGKPCYQPSIDMAS